MQAISIIACEIFRECLCDMKAVSITCFVSQNYTRLVSTASARCFTLPVLPDQTFIKPSCLNNSSKSSRNAGDMRWCKRCMCARRRISFLSTGAAQRRELEVLEMVTKCQKISSSPCSGPITFNFEVITGKTSFIHLTTRESPGGE